MGKSRANRANRKKHKEDDYFFDIPWPKADTTPEPKIEKSVIATIFIEIFSPSKFLILFLV